MVVRWGRSLILGLILFLVISGVASAVKPDSIVLTSTKSWLVANGMDATTIEVLVKDHGTDYKDAEINFTVLNADLGTCGPDSVISGPNGRNSTTFTVKTRPGNVTIRATTEGENLTPLTSTLILNIIAPYPDETHITSSADWLIANGSDRATITVSAFNTTATRSPIAGLNVIFSVNNSIFGSCNPATVQTNTEGNASTTFTTGKKSGVANISGNLTGLVNGVPEIRLNLLQKIDHDTPYRILDYNYSNEMEVANISPVVFSYSDRWGNLIDNRRFTEEVSISITSPSPEYNATLSLDTSTYSTNITIPVDGNGSTKAFVRMNTRPGWNILIIHPSMYTSTGEQAIADKYLTIEGVPSKPARIEANFDPSTFRLPADGVSKFNITYTMWDRWDNLVQNRTLRIDTSIPGEGRWVGTNAQGVAMITYGPKMSIGRVVINATALDNSLVNHSQEVWFTAMVPVDMVLSANPETVPSRDVRSDSSSQITATVIDINGTPVQNEVVTFSIDNIRISPSYNATTDPTFANGNSVTSGTTNENGYAYATFRPGSFTTDKNHPKYSDTATGMCDVSSTWGGKTKTVTLTWKNYPYISVKSITNTNITNVNETIDVDIALIGDGWALRPKPVDVILLLDNSGTMGRTNQVNDGISKSKIAAVSFVNKMQPGRDRVGVIFYDKGFSIYIPPTYNLTQVTSAISNYKREFDPKGYHTRTRNGLYNATTLLKNLNDRNATKVIIHMTDGLWSMEGDPLARGYGFNTTFNDTDVYPPSDTSEKTPGGLHSVWAGNDVNGETPVLNRYRYFDDIGGATPKNESKTNFFPKGQQYDSGTTWVSDTHESEQLNNTIAQWGYYFTNGEGSNQNMSNYAKNSNVRIYSIGFKSGSGVNIGTTLTNTLTVMSDATGGYYRYAPNDTELNNVYTKIAGELKEEASVNTVMDLDYNEIEMNNVTVTMNATDPFYDYVFVYHVSTKITSSKNGTVLSGYPQYLDQTSNWSSTKQLTFNIGTIKLGQIWEAKYRLNMTHPGYFSLFGVGSAIIFDGTEGHQVLTPPETHVFVVACLTQTNVSANELFYVNVSEAGGMTGPESELFKTFNISSIYTGTHNVTEDYFIVTYDGRRWFVGSRVLTPVEAAHERTFRIRVVDLPAGWRYLDPVANVFDAPGPARIPPAPISQAQMDPNKTYIILS